jgi:predicted RNA-binding Zn-ribbon protein involved in translation (DUF1610 family)
VTESLPGLERKRRKRKPPPATTCTDVVLVDLSRCPTCGAEVHTTGWGQPALFYFGGFGATVLRTIRRCTRCGWALPADETSLNPRHP